MLQKSVFGLVVHGTVGSPVRPGPEPSSLLKAQVRAKGPVKYDWHVDHKGGFEVAKSPFKQPTGTPNTSMSGLVGSFKSYP